MKRNPVFRLTCIFSFLFAFALAAVAQEFPFTLVKAYPQSVEKLSSEGAAERASVLNELVYPVPQSCTMELGLKYELPKEDYVFVVGKVLEKDLRGLADKQKVVVWTYLSHLITKFEMREFASAVAGYADDNDWQVQAVVVRSLRSLKSTELDGKLAPLLGAYHQYVRERTLETLIEFKSKKATPALVSKLWSENSSDRYWALEKLADIDAVEAAPRVAERLKDDEAHVRYGAIETLARLNAKNQSAALWLFLKTNTDKRQEGYAIAALAQFEQKDAVPLVVADMKAVASGSTDSYIGEYVRKLKPKFLIPELISLYNTKTKFFTAEQEETRFRWQILQLLYEYKSTLAIPIYRENLVDRSPRREGASSWVAGLLQEMDAREAIDDIIVSFNDLSKTATPGSNDDHRAGEFAVVLAKFGEKKTWKMLVDFEEKTGFYGRERIFVELNKHLDKKLWDRTHSVKPTQQLAPVKTIVEKLSGESGIPITIADIPRTDVCSLEATDDPNAIACGYSDPRNSLHDNLQTLLSILNNRKRGQYTFIYDNGTIRILSVNDAILFWKKNILSKIG